MTILDTIVARKKEEVRQNKLDRPVRELLALPGTRRPLYSLVETLTDGLHNGIIAEFKRKSPSKGIINADADPGSVTSAYSSCGISGLSVLTDLDFFGGSSADLASARVNTIPVLRKDFIVDEYQVTEARAMGADVILLIAACLSPEQVRDLAAFANSMQLEVLLEVHNEEELEHVCADVDLIGINTRDLKTFQVDMAISERLIRAAGHARPVIAESGIHDPASILQLRRLGFSGFLIGERFMREADPGSALHDFVQTLKMLEDEPAGEDES